jgi:uncharacterized membrane protein YphA (DoxX/SURF4 family)
VRRRRRNISMMVPKAERLRPAVHLVCRGLPAALFLWAGVAKILDRQSAILAVDAYDVVPRALVEPVAIVLPWIEVGIAILLILGLFTRFAGWATAAMIAIYLVAMGQAKARGLAIDCGCFGGGGPGTGVTWWDLLRDVPLLLAGLTLARTPSGPLQLDRWFLEGSHDERHEVEDEVPRIEDTAPSR